ncbi:MAG TPA: TetR family transcriptional regulator C-terminal domain-containing protein, partial [Paracoccaceae bacterium]|nr:TetR family transcriptional regulator C-terminal domain-containing protein [Paracoccaceae bacterium]
LRVYQRRLHSNLVHALRPLCAAPVHVAETLAALIDGVYIRQSLGRGQPDRAEAAAQVLGYLDLELAKKGAA